MQERYELKTIMMEFLQRMNCSPSQVMKFLQKKKKKPSHEAMKTFFIDQIVEIHSLI